MIHGVLTKKRTKKETKKEMKKKTAKKTKKDKEKAGNTQQAIQKRPKTKQNNMIMTPEMSPKLRISS